MAGVTGKKETETLKIPVNNEKNVSTIGKEKEKQARVQVAHVDQERSAGTCGTQGQRQTKA